MITSAPALLSELRRRGFTLSASGPGLLIKPASQLTPTDRGFLYAHARGIEAIIAKEAIPVWIVLDSTDPEAIGGKWIGNKWYPPAPERTSREILPIGDNVSLP